MIEQKDNFIPMLNAFPGLLSVKSAKAKIQALLYIILSK